MVVVAVGVSWLTLHKTNWPNFNAKFLVGAANIHRGNIYDGQACHVLCSVFKDSLAHISISFLELNGTIVNSIYMHGMRLFHGLSTFPLFFGKYPNDT